jgi:glycosyltransferase involved in cell wall biosynthesis
MDRLSDRSVEWYVHGGRRRLRVLLSAYACEPDKGSEPGIGWQWALHLAAAGHEVHAITRANNRAAIEQALSRQPVSGLQFSYYDLPRWARGWKRGGRGVHLYYVLWQWGAFQLARRLCRARRFDVVHHITFGVFRQPSFMAFLGLPFVFGPVGGGERAPSGLRRSFPLRGKIVDRLRDLANAWVTFDPLMHAVFHRASVILCKTPETLAAIPLRYRAKCRLQLEIGAIAVPAASVPSRRHGGGLHVLYAGRLVYLKGVHLALVAFAALRQTFPNARFTIIGSGPEQAWLHRLAEKLGVTAAVDWRPWLPRAELMETYSRHDVLLFPSLHDSSGNAVLEALANGVPVVCLNLGGPRVLVDDRCGIRVSADDERGAIDGLAAALSTLARDRERRARMARAARARAQEEFSWFRQTEKMSRIYLIASAAPILAQEGVS